MRHDRVIFYPDKKPPDDGYEEYLLESGDTVLLLVRYSQDYSNENIRDRWDLYVPNLYHRDNNDALIRYPMKRIYSSDSEMEYNLLKEMFYTTRVQWLVACL